MAHRSALPATRGANTRKGEEVYAAAVLFNPNDAPSFRAIAATCTSPTAISNAAKRLSDAGLIGRDGNATLPEVFWASAEVWNASKAVALPSVKAGNDPVRRRVRADHGHARR